MKRILFLSCFALAHAVPWSHQERPREEAAEPAERTGELTLERELAARVSEERAQKRVRELCALGPRMGGTASGERAAAYIGKAFKTLGLEVDLVEDPERWCHEETHWLVRAHTTGQEPLTLERAWPYGFSPSAKGKVALTTDGEDCEAAALLSARRPRRSNAALVLVDGSTTGDGSYPKVHHLRAGDSNPAPMFGLSQGEGEQLRAWLDEGRAVEIEFELRATIAQAKPQTVVATLPGSSREGGHWLFCAHGDSDAGGPGADDNASGIAVLLEIAQAWSEAIAAGEVAAPPHDVRFAIWGTEIHSTRHYLENHRGELLGVLNYDQAGFGSGADQLNIEPDDVPANVAFVRTALSVLGDHSSSELFPKQWATNRSLGGTDSYVFSGDDSFESGLPAVTLFTSAWDAPAEHPRTEGMPGESWSERDKVRVDYDNYYHSGGDTPENTTDKEPWNMGWCARAGLLSARRFLASQ